ncbi:MAG: hypothetical protein AB7R89_19485 [Dehalococcoidia bacterium]
MVLSRGVVIPGLDWVISASEVEMLDFLGADIDCPRCGAPLRQDPHHTAPNLLDDFGHRFSNIRALVVELYQQGRLRPKGPLLVEIGRIGQAFA